LRSIYEGARDMARAISAHRRLPHLKARTKESRDAVRPPQTHPEVLKLDRLRLRGPNGARDEFHLAATAQNLRKLAKLIPMPESNPA